MINVDFFITLFLVSLRLIAFFTVLNVFFPKNTPQLVKISFAIILSYIIVPGIGLISINTVTNPLTFFILCLTELINGATMGFMVELCFFSFQTAGAILDMQMGFSMMTMFDPNSNVSAAMVQRILYWMALILFMLCDGHHFLIRTIVESFNSVPLGIGVLQDTSIKLIMKAFIEFFSIGLRIAIPIVLIIILIDLTMGLVARTVPQLNIMILGMPVKFLVGLITLVIALPIISSLMKLNFTGIEDMFKAFFKIFSEKKVAFSGFATFPFMLIIASDDKTEEATPQKKQEARKKGQVAKSKEASLALTLVMSTLVISVFGNYIIEGIKQIMIAFLGNYLNYELTYSTLKGFTFMVMLKGGLLILSVALPIMVMGIAANVLQTGVLFTKEPLKPDFKKLNPINGFKRMFSLRSVMELLKSIGIITVTGIIGYNFVKDNYTNIMNISSYRLETILEYMKSLTTSIFFKISLVMVIIALADYLYQRYQYNKDLKMTKQEIKEEFKQQEGDPQIKGKIRQKQREMAQRRMMQSIPSATVVVTNPTHIAVALKYNKGDEAPVVVAKGADQVALKIKKVAKESEVPIIENRPLARTLYEKVEIDEEVPMELYGAVAETLAMIYSLKK